MNNNHIESLEFLKSLGEQMEAQENDSQADPHFWVVAENKREYGIADGYQDGTAVCGPDGAIFETVDGTKMASSFRQQQARLFYKALKGWSTLICTEVSLPTGICEERVT